MFFRVKRFQEKPLITPEQVKHYHQAHEVIGVFNAGVAKFQDEILLLLRFPERPKSVHPDTVKISFIDFLGVRGSRKRSS